MKESSEISPLTRVEGHGRIIVEREGGRVTRVTLSLYDSPRLFEALLLGKRYDELPEIICRICSLCSTVHRVCALLAVEKALAVTVSEQTRLYRELIVNGGHIESHALHLFCLVLPDHYDTSGFAGLATRAPEEFRRGLRIKAAGNLVQETVGGRLIHPVTLIPGGMGKPLDKAGLLKLKEAFDAVLPDAYQAYEQFRDFSFPAVELPHPRYLAVRTETVPLFGNSLVSGDASFPAEVYRELLGETVVAYSNAKRSVVKGEPATVGALARLNLGMALSPKAAQAFRDAAPLLTGKDIRANNLAQAVELIHALERSLEIIDTLLQAGFAREEPVVVIPRKGSGTGLIEAPRGTLIHSYTFDSRGFCTAADVVTPTAINQAAMERDLFQVAKQLEDADEEAMTAALECLVRAYDPCISCAVHVVRI
jgi:sulfhydrogenase subunit alpha